MAMAHASISVQVSGKASSKTAWSYSTGFPGSSGHTSVAVPAAALRASMNASHAAMTRCQLYPLVAASTRSISFWIRRTQGCLVGARPKMPGENCCLYTAWEFVWLEPLSFCLLRAACACCLDARRTKSVAWLPSDLPGTNQAIHHRTNTLCPFRLPILSFKK